MKAKRKSHNLAIIACVCVIFVFSTIGNAEPIVKENSGLQAIGPPPLPPTERNLSPNTNGFGQTISKNITAKPLNSRTTYTITLQEGWNYISVPYWLASGYDEAYDLFYDVDCGGRTIWEYDGLHGWMPVSATTKIKPLDGICIYSVETDTIDLNLDTNNRTATVKTLYSGYNLIGFMDPYLSPNDGTEFHSAYARNFLATLGDQWSQVFGWDTSTQAYETNWIFRGSGDPNSDFRKLYPNQGYMVLLSSNGTLTINNQPTYLASAEWVNDYSIPNLTNLTQSSLDANGFANTINTIGYWSLPQTGPNNKFFGDNTNPMPTGDHWTTVNDSNYMDSTNLAYFDGHGGPGGIVFGDGSEAGYSDIAWGDTLGYKQLAWVALGACSVLNNTGINTNSHWDTAFHGLHGIVGWETDSYADEDFGLYFADHMSDGYSVWESWKFARDQTYYQGLGVRRVAILAAQGTDGDCYYDHLYGYGSWVAPGDHFTPGIHDHLTIHREYYPTM